MSGQWLGISPPFFCLFHDLLLRSYLYHCIWSVTTAQSLTPEKRHYYYSPHSLTPMHLVPTQQHSTYNWYLSLLWVSVMYIVLRLVGLVPRSSLSLRLGFSATA